MSVVYPLFAFEKDDQSMFLITGQEGIAYHCEAIDIENAEYVFWDSVGEGMRQSLQEQSVWSYSLQACVSARGCLCTICANLESFWCCVQWNAERNLGRHPATATTPSQEIWLSLKALFTMTGKYSFRQRDQLHTINLPSQKPLAQRAKLFYRISREELNLRYAKLASRLVECSNFLGDHLCS
jgi:hypothetical protein